MITISFNMARNVSFGYSRSLFSNIQYSPFEQHSFPIPRDYIIYLERVYGDWRSFPAVEKRVNKHWHTILKLDRPYESVVKPLFESDADYVAYGV